MSKQDETLSLSRLLSEPMPKLSGKKSQKELESLQLKMLRIQQGIWHNQGRTVIAFEGFDAAGKGGAIRRLTETLDPRGARVHPIGPPEPYEKGQHYLTRFWTRLPAPGTISIFDRTWYGRVLVERVENLTPKARWKAAYAEINEFEAQLVADGIDVVKIFLGITPEEQLERFEARLHDPYKQWKLQPSDIEAHAKWAGYVEATDDLLKKTNTKTAPWHLVPANDKDYARLTVLKIVTDALMHHHDWMETTAARNHRDELRAALDQLEAEKAKWKTS